MKPADREDSLLRALDLLPDGDPAKGDPRFVKNPQLAADAWEHRETAVNAWLAVAPLSAAPPEILENVLARISPPEAGEVVEALTWKRWPAILGWAAAIVMACLWLIDRREAPAVVEKPPAGSERQVSNGREIVVPLARPGSRTNDRKLGEEIARLRKALEVESGRGHTPRVRTLSVPGAAAEDPEEARERLQRILINALRSSLEARTGAPGDSASLVIERGWLPQGMSPLRDGETIRHRNFPEDAWADHGLLKANEDAFYDPTNSVIWERDPEGRGFIGRKPTEADDLNQYQRTEGTEPPKSGTPFANAEPSGFLIENPDKPGIDVVIEGIVPPPEGSTQWLVWTIPGGASYEQLVTNEMFTPSGTFIGSSSVPGLGNLNAGASLNFEFQVRSNSGAVVTIIGGGTP